MTKSLRVSLIMVNAVAILLAAGSLFFLITMRESPQLPFSHEHLVSKVDKLSDLPRLRSMIADDDNHIRLLQLIIGLSRRWARSILILFGVFALFNLTLIFFGSRGTVPPDLRTDAAKTE